MMRSEQGRPWPQAAAGPRSWVVVHGPYYSARKGNGSADSEQGQDMLGLVVAAGFVNWVATVIVVESSLFFPVRRLFYRIRMHKLIDCGLCVGTWVGFFLAILTPGPFNNMILDGLLYKSLGHVLWIAQHVMERINSTLYHVEMDCNTIATRIQLKGFLS